MPFIPSPQQKAVFTWAASGQGNAFVEAVAGSGKTTTLIEACKRMSGSVAFAAYNKKIADEIKVRLQRIGMSSVRAGTFHSFGYGAWRKLYPTVQVDDRDKRDQMVEYLDVPQELKGLVIQLVSLAKQSAVGAIWQPDDLDNWNQIIDHYDLMWNVDADPEEAAAKAIAYAQKGIEWARATADELIDYDDMIWLPATTAHAPVWQNDWVLVDEAQDTNPARRILARKMMNPRRGRAIFVGDPHQAIYGFTGADADAIELIMQDFKCQSFPLTITYRCPRAVVEMAQRYVSHIECGENAPEGLVRSVYDRESFRQQEIPQLKPGHAILCRKTAPLVSLAFALIRQAIPAHVEGKEIGQGLATLAKKWKSIVTVEQLNIKLDGWLDSQVERLTEKKQEHKIEGLRDRIETIKILGEGCETITELVNKIYTIFRDSNGGEPTTVILSTVHKAKGREWKRVYILGFEEYMPSRMARQKWQMEQENNLIYVAVTRSMEELILTVALEDQQPTYSTTPKRVKKPRTRR